jgi:hypothetical protein
MTPAKILTPLHIKFLNWYIEELKRKKFDTGPLVNYLNRMIHEGCYREDDTDSLNRMVHINKQLWLSRKQDQYNINDNAKTINR